MAQDNDFLNLLSPWFLQQQWGMGVDGPTLKEKRNAPLIFLKFLPEFCEIKCMCLNPTYVLDILAQ